MSNSFEILGSKCDKVNMKNPFLPDFQDPKETISNLLLIAASTILGIILGFNIARLIQMSGKSIISAAYNYISLPGIIISVSLITLSVTLRKQKVSSSKCSL